MYYDTGIACETGVEYLVEMQLDFTNQLFYSYITDLTHSGERMFLGGAEIWSDNPIKPGDETTGGYIIIDKGSIDVLYDDLNLVDGTLPVFKPGDADRNQVVDERDAAILANNWLSGTKATWNQGDFNADGVVNDLDAVLMATNWMAAGSSASVPEPSAFVAMFGLFFGLLFLRREK